MRTVFLGEKKKNRYNSGADKRSEFSNFVKYVEGAQQVKPDVQFNIRCAHAHSLHLTAESIRSDSVYTR